MLLIQCLKLPKTTKSRNPWFTINNSTLKFYNENQKSSNGCIQLLYNLEHEFYLRSAAEKFIFSQAKYQCGHIICMYTSIDIPESNTSKILKTTASLTKFLSVSINSDQHITRCTTFNFSETKGYYHWNKPFLLQLPCSLDAIACPLFYISLTSTDLLYT